MKKELNYSLYLKGFNRAMGEMEAKKDEGGIALVAAVKKAIWYGVLAIGNKNKVDYITNETNNKDWLVLDTVVALMRTTTPKEFMEIFPINKEYDGDKFCTKDYFSTREFIDSMPEDRWIGPKQEDVFNFLWDYYNKDTRKFLLKAMNLMDNSRALSGTCSIAEEFSAITGIKSYSMYKDINGNEFLLDNEKRKTIKIKNKRASHLRLVKNSNPQANGSAAISADN